MATAPIEPTPIDTAPKVPVLGSLEFDDEALAYTTWEATKLRPQANALGQTAYQNATASAESAASAGESKMGAQQAAQQAAQSAALAAAGANATAWNAATVYQPGSATTAPSAVYDPNNSPGITYRYIGATAGTAGRPKDTPSKWAVLGAASMFDPMGELESYAPVFNAAAEAVSATFTASGIAGTDAFTWVGGEVQTQVRTWNGMTLTTTFTHSTDSFGNRVTTFTTTRS